MSSPLSTSRRVGRFRRGAAGVLFVLATMTEIWGCDSGSFVPPPPEELAESAGSTASDSASGSVGGPMEPVGARTLEVFLDRCSSDVADILKSAARAQAGLDVVKLDINVLGEGDLPTQQVEVVRAALVRHPLAVVVEPVIPPDGRLAAVLSEARSDGVPVVVLNRPLASDQGTASDGNVPKAAVGTSATQPGARDGATAMRQAPSPLVVVKTSPFISSAAQLVASAVRNAANARMDPGGGAVLLINTLGDPSVSERVAALRTALKDAGIAKIQEVPFSKDSEAGSKVLTAKLQADPKLVLVFAVDSLSSLAGREVVIKVVLDRPFILAGYASDDTYANSTRMGDFAAIAIYSPAKLLRKAMSTAVALARGRDLPALVEVPIEIVDSPPESTTAKSPIFYKKKSEMSKKGF
jgi:ABC-type sugar transport system substrate-binding protein